VTPFPWSDVLIIAGLILLNGVFAMSELAIVSARPARLRVAAERGSPGARVALALAKDPGKFLSTVQIGITLIGIEPRSAAGRTADRARPARPLGAGGRLRHRHRRHHLF
jgi:putative hemolysin